MNLGIRDAAALAQVLTQAQQRGQDIGSLKILRRYERWRRLETLAILMFTDVLDRLFSNNWWWLRRLRRLGLWGMNRIWLVRHLSLRLMTGLSGRLPDLAQPGLKSTVDCS
jgi:2-octaprenyl-6-methoxyphenol hydroxylase